MNTQEFQSLLKPIINAVEGEAIDQDLARTLNERFPPGEEFFDSIENACHQAISEGWMCAQGAEGRRFGRIIEPSEDTAMLSVDVVDLTNIVGPHHKHPTGEVCMIMPTTEEARFDGMGRGWCVYEPGSDHRPTVTNGEALVLYMLPHGRIEFTGK
ncbi:MAG: DUF4863 family protein [Arenicellales bacterium]